MAKYSDGEGLTIPPNIKKELQELGVLSEKEATGEGETEPMITAPTGVFPVRRLSDYFPELFRQDEKGG